MVRGVPLEITRPLALHSNIVLILLLIGVNTSRSIDPTPSINVHPPSLSTPPPFPPQPFSPTDTNASASYIPPSDRLPSPQRQRATSQPPPMSNGPRKSVAFAEAPELNTPNPPESEASSPEKARRRERANRGYEAGDDTDSTPDDQRRRQRAEGGGGSRSLDPAAAERNGEEREGGSGRRRHRRRRSADPSSTFRGEPSSSRGAPIDTNVSSSKVSKENRPTSPAESDATVDLPARFDNQGRKKTEAGDDPVADRIDEMLKGKGVGGRLFGNFVDGIFGPEGRDGRGKKDKR